MRSIPAITSILSPSGISDYARSSYNLSGQVICVLLKAGINHTYRIQSNEGLFVFRIYCYNWRTVGEIEAELQLLQSLYQRAVSVSQPLADVRGEYIQHISAPEGTRYGVLFSFAKGEKRQNYNNEIHYEVGRLMAAIHHHTKNLIVKRVHYTQDVLLYQSLEHINGFLPEETDEMQFLKELLPLLENKLMEAQQASVPKGVVHLDMWFDNFAISDQGKITVFDFDFCGNGNLCLDVAYYVMQLYNTEKDEKERETKVASFYEGYESICTISEVEKSLIPVLGVCLYYFYLGTQCKRFNDWSSSFLNEVYLKKYINQFIKPYAFKTGLVMSD